MTCMNMCDGSNNKGDYENDESCHIHYIQDLLTVSTMQQEDKCHCRQSDFKIIAEDFQLS